MNKEELKPQDLRIGNLFNPSQPVQVEAWMLLPESNVVFEPIPLTEEWLEKFGFEYDQITFQKSLLMISFSSNWDKSTIWINSFAFGKIERHDVIYVHQLQNLFFALTGEELTLTETP